MRGLERDVADWEDPLALDGGPDGLRVARLVLEHAPSILAEHAHTAGADRAVWLELDTSGPPLLQCLALERQEPWARRLHKGNDAVKSYDDASGRPRFARLTFQPQQHTQAPDR